MRRKNEDSYVTDKTFMKGDSIMTRVRLTKENRMKLESKLEEYLQHSRHRLEAFTDLDYFAAGADAIWRKAHSRTRKMPNYELIGICENIDEDNKRNTFATYYDVFNWEK